MRLIGVIFSVNYGSSFGILGLIDTSKNNNFNFDLPPSWFLIETTEY